MTVYHKSRKLIIVDSGILGMLEAITRNTQFIHTAHEIWIYSKASQRFRSYKSRCDDAKLLIEFFADHSIKLACSAARISSAAPIEYRFDTDKDLFLFNLKF